MFQTQAAPLPKYIGNFGVKKLIPSPVRCTVVFFSGLHFPCETLKKEERKDMLQNNLAPMQLLKLKFNSS